MTNQSLIVLEERDTHSAIFSWSGYDYQGKVAIYWAIHLINQLDIFDGSIQDYSLEIENLEDFTIKYKENPYSIHQVKSYQNNPSFSKYQEAVLEMMGKCAKYNSINFMYLHTCCLIGMPTKEELKDTLSKLNPTKKIEQFTEYKDLLFEKNKYDLVYEKLFVNNTEAAFGKRVIDLLEIDNEIKEEIKVFYQNNYERLGLRSSESEENINFIFYNLVDEVNKFVFLSHKKMLKDPEIALTTFLQILEDEFVFKFSLKTIVSMLKSTLEEYFKEYCEMEGLGPHDCESWLKNWREICLLDDREFILLCKKLSPNLNINIKNITLYDYKDLLVKTGVHKTLLPMVLQAGNFALDIKGLSELFVLNKVGKHHLITTIADVAGRNSVEIQGEKIFNSLKNDNKLTPLLFDIDKLITTELEGQFEGTVVDVGQAYEEFSEELELKETITVPKKLEFIAVEKAKEIFR